MGETKLYKREMSVTRRIMRVCDTGITTIRV